MFIISEFFATFADIRCKFTVVKFTEVSFTENGIVKDALMKFYNREKELASLEKRVLLYQSSYLQLNARYLGSIQETKPCQSCSQRISLYAHESNIQRFRRTVIWSCRHDNEAIPLHYICLKRNLGRP